MRAENQKNLGYPQRNSAEHEEYARARSTGTRKGAEQGGADLLERILSRENLNRAYKRVKANKGAPGIDGMTIEEALPWLRKNRDELLESIRQGKHKPQPVRRKEIPKPDGGVRKLGIPTVVDRINRAAANPHLRTEILRDQLRLSIGEKCTASDRAGQGVRGRRVYPGGLGRPVQVLRHAEP